MKKEKQNILAIHLLNDYSGSPLILRNVLQQFHENNYNIHLITNKEEGFLSELKGIDRSLISYSWSPNKLVTLFRFLVFQIVMTIKILGRIRSVDIIYINTLLPVFAAFIGHITGKKVITHVHETSIKPKSLKRILKKLACHFSDDLIFVSEYLMKQEHFNHNRKHIVANSLSEDFLVQRRLKTDIPLGKPEILMLCSLKDYKGIKEFISASRLLPQFNFVLVINSSQENIDKYMDKVGLGKNIDIHPAQSNVHPYYSRASLVLNLSIPGQWEETFGMTALEAMSYGKPVIVPPVGGIAELVRHGVDGLHIDSRNTEALVHGIKLIFSNLKTYLEYSKKAYERSLQYNIHNQYKQIENIICEKGDYIINLESEEKLSVS